MPNLITEGGGGLETGKKLLRNICEVWTAPNLENMFLILFTT